MAVAAGTALLLGGAGVGGYLMLKQDGSAVTGEQQPQPKPSPTPGGTSLQERLMAQRGFTYGSTGLNRLAHPYIDGGRAADVSMQSAIQQAEKEIKAAYEKLSGDARKAGAKALNQQLGTNLTGDESFEEAGQVIGAALGGSLAAAGCAAAGLGAVSMGCKALGAIVGAYLGGKLSEWLGDAWDHVEDWAADQWDSVEDAAEDAYNFLSGLF